MTSINISQKRLRLFIKLKELPNASTKMNTISESVHPFKNLVLAGKVK